MVDPRYFNHWSSHTAMGLASVRFVLRCEESGAGTGQRTCGQIYYVWLCGQIPF